MHLGSGDSALVTGACSGLGLAAARELASSGAKVLMLDLPNPSGERLAEELSGASYWRGDVTDEASVAEAVRRAQSVGRFAVVVNCAGIAGPNPMVGPHEGSRLQRFLDVLRINAAGTFNVMQQAAAAMAGSADDADEECGVVINTGSTAAFDGQISETAYSASKGAVAAMTLPAARELARYRIRVVTIAPGRFRTPLMENFHKERLANVVADVPHPHRLGRPEEFAALVRHVIENPMINGEVIRIDAALRMAY